MKNRKFTIEVSDKTIGNFLFFSGLGFLTLIIISWILSVNPIIGLNINWQFYVGITLGILSAALIIIGGSMSDANQ